MMNHASWWDPLVGLLLADALVPSRDVCAPMDAEQLRRIGIFRRLGVFGVDPDDPATLPAMVEHVTSLFRAQTRPTLWITPQGKFTDVRVPVRLRPGAASIAARCDSIRVIAVAVEYAFWQDQLPEIFIGIEEVLPERRSVSGWHRGMQATLQRSLDRLREGVVAREPDRFEPLLAGRAGRTGFFYDLWLRLRGRDGAIVAEGRANAKRREIA